MSPYIRICGMDQKLNSSLFNTIPNPTFESQLVYFPDGCMDVWMSGDQSFL